MIEIRKLKTLCVRFRYRFCFVLAHRLYTLGERWSRLAQTPDPSLRIVSQQHLSRCDKKKKNNNYRTQSMINRQQRSLTCYEKKKEKKNTSTVLKLLPGTAAEERLL